MSKTSPTDTDEPISGAVDESKKGVDRDAEFFLSLASSNYTTSRGYMDASLTTEWERNADHFHSRHFRRSAYMTKLYNGRSKIFRPLTRATERSSSAQAASALFSNLDFADILPENQNNKNQLAVARMMKKILGYYLDKKIPWFLTVMGAWQDTRVYGPCVTKTRWAFDEIEVETTIAGAEVLGVEVVVDEPVIDMLPVENVLLDPACDWRDPINTSPYVTVLMPMYIVDIEARMDRIDTKTGQPEWIRHTREQMLSVDQTSYNSVRQARDGDQRPNPQDSQERPEFKLIWIHENFVRIDGQELIYYTLGTTFMLTEVKRLEDVYGVGQRPLTYGVSIIEAHRFAPSSQTHLIANLQAGVNDIANLRIDNVRLALNKRYFIRRGAVIDLEALMRSVPGGGIFTENPDKDVKVIETRDVTGSSYKEQERLETESNDLSGTFLGGSVQNNRGLSETVGGMEMLAEGANALSEFDIKTFAETFVKPQLELLVMFIQKFADDVTMRHIAFSEVDKELNLIPSGAPDEEAEKLRDELSERVLKDKLSLRVNVGLGAVSPQRKAQTLNTTIGSIIANPAQIEKIDWDEVTKEQFAIAGYQDGARFLISKDSEDVPELTDEDVQAAYDQGAAEASDKVGLAKVEMEREKAANELAWKQKEKQLELAMKYNTTMETIQAKLSTEQNKDKTKRDIAATQSANARRKVDSKVPPTRGKT